jgi:hypothetical protein
VLVDKAKAMATADGDWTAVAEALHLSVLLMIARGQLSEVRRTNLSLGFSFPSCSADSRKPSLNARRLPL